jgi:hypothetical protein
MDMRMRVGMAAIVAALVGSSASASLMTGRVLDASQYRISAAAEPGTPFSLRDTGTIYDSRLAGSAGGTSVTQDAEFSQEVRSQYTSIGVDPNYLTSFIFVGGVAAVNQVLFFQFYDSASMPVSDFGVQLPQAGNFVWTITLAQPIPIANVGHVGLIPNTGVTGTFRFASTAPAVGTSTDVSDGKPGFYRYQITVPTPASASLLALGGLVALRRRR